MAVAGLDSTFHWRFVITDKKLSLPGYLPQDAQKVRQAIQLVISDLKKRQWIKNPEIILCGYSMGGLQDHGILIFSSSVFFNRNAEDFLFSLPTPIITV